LFRSKLFIVELPNKEELLKVKEEYKAPVILSEAEKKVVEPTDKSKGGAAAAAEVVIVPEDKPTIDSLSDDELIAALEKRGKKIATETLTDEQKKRQAETEEVEKREFAIKNLNMTNEQYDEIKNIIAADGTELTKKEFAKSYKSENKTATKEEIDAAYNDYYNLPQTVTEKEKRVKRDENGKAVLKGTEFDDVEEEEVEVPKAKFDEKLSKWGESRIKTKAERIKGNAKAALDQIDAAYNNQKALVAKANEYVKVAEKVLSEIDFNALPVRYKFGEKGKEKEIKAIVKLNDEAKAQVQEYINTQLAAIVLPTDKYKDADEIKKQIVERVKQQYENQVAESLWSLGRRSGLNDGKIGGSASFEKLTPGASEEVIGALEKSVAERLPDNPLIKNRK
jgi:hypothetical protein